MEIRGTHPHCYRSGVWATVRGVEWFLGRQSFRIVFDDGMEDLWPIYGSDDYGYEFRGIGE